MKIEYDPAHDLMNIEFIAKEPIAESVELDGVVIDYSEPPRDENKWSRPRKAGFHIGYFHGIIE